MTSLDFSEFCRTKGLTDETVAELQRCDYADTETLRTLTADEIRKYFKGKITNVQMCLLMDVVDELNSFDLPREPVGLDVPTDDMTRIILIGKTGAGKSSTGNTIIGEEVFHVEAGTASAPFGVSAKTARMSVDGERLFVLDTPGLTDTRMELKDVALHITQCMTLCTPGPHVVLFIIKMGRFTTHEHGIYESLKGLFGNDLLNHMILVFTGVPRKERLADPLKQVHEEKNPQELFKTLEEVGNRCIFLDNKESGRDENVRKLLDIICDLTTKTKVGFFEKGKMAEVNVCVQAAVAKMAEDNLDSKHAKLKYLQAVEMDVNRVKEIESKIGMRRLLRSVLKGLAIGAVGGGAAGAVAAIGAFGGPVTLAVGAGFGTAGGGLVGGVGGGVYSHATGQELCGIL